MAEVINVKPKKSKSFIESESYKKLRTNVQFSGKEIKVIALTSSVPNEGKTEVSFKLAWSLAETEKKTLYLDADLRNSTFLMKHDVHKELKGLAHYLVGENTLEQVISKTQNPFLDVIPAGAFPPNPSELLSQDVYSELISELKERYDYVIIDTPPTGLVVDGVLASSRADGVIVVISSGMVSSKMVNVTLDELKKANCKVLGCILNKCGQGSKNASGYGYGTNYGYAGSYGRDYGYGYGYGYGKRYANNKSNPFKNILKNFGKKSERKEK